MPTYAQLPTVPDTAERHAWDVWGRDDQLGAVNFVDPYKVRDAAGLVRTGRVISLNLPLNEPTPGLFEGRTAPGHHITKTGHGLDDRLDGFYLQFSSQWDGLRHVRFRKYGFWGGRQDADLEEGDEIGVENWSRHGLVTRAVLVDARRHFELRGDPFEPDQTRRLTPADLDAILSAQGSIVCAGDVVIIRTGWLEWYLNLAPDDRRRMVGSVGRQHDPLGCPGLHAGPETAAWLWDHRVAGAAADNPTLEALPVDRVIGFLHYRLLPLLGIPIGELWSLGELARHCAEENRYDFLLFSGILDLPGGVGSPANAYAVF